MLHKIESPLPREKGIQFSDCIRFSKELALKRVSNSQSLVCTHLVFFFVLNWFPTPQAKDTRELPQGVLLIPASLHSTLSAQPCSFFPPPTGSPGPLCYWATTGSVPHQPDGWAPRPRRDSREWSCAFSPTVRVPSLFPGLPGAGGPGPQL